jgi:hypothetical protein
MTEWSRAWECRSKPSTRRNRARDKRMLSRRNRRVARNTVAAGGEHDDRVYRPNGWDVS